MKLNKAHFSSETVIVHFLVKPYHKINVKSYLNSVLFVNKEKFCQRFAHVPCDFFSLYLFVLTFAMKSRSDNYKSHWNILVFCNQWKMKNSNMSHGKMSDFLNVWISFSLFGFTLGIKLKNFDFESHWTTLVFFYKKIYGVRYAYVLWKNVWVCFISILWIYFSHKLRNFAFKGH